ncbi:hypothetical protein WJX73_004592 [Symbiochloris irregularis]|uniref:Uncharacterized protein n=1 Tax=Symbiochloris irregularis TaxID=706552 RepID=A0AAW1NW74_9CHLO
MEADSLPMQSAPHDTLRYGLSSLKDEAAAAHPVQVLEQKYPQQQWDSKEKMLNSVYGGAFTARLQIERQILGRVQRPPGMQSSRLVISEHKVVVVQSKPRA